MRTPQRTDFQRQQQQPGRSRPAAVSVLVPSGDAVEWRSWLTTALGEQASLLGLDFDGAEEGDRFEVFDFEGDPELVQQAVQAALETHRVQRWVTRTFDMVFVAKGQ